MNFKKAVFAFCAASVLVFTALRADAQSPAPVVVPGPKVLPAAAQAQAPAVAPAPVIASAPALSSAPAIQSAPATQSAPAVQSAPRTTQVQPSGKAPYVQNAPQLNSGGATNSLSRGAQQQGADMGGGNIIEISGGQTTSVPRGTVLITIEGGDDEAAAVPQSRAAKAAAANKAAQEKAVAGLKAWDKKLVSLKTGFEQSSSYEGTEISKSSGVLYFSKPNKIRLESLNAAGKATQITLTDKKKIKVFDAAMKPVKTYDWKDWFESQPNKAFFDFGNYSALLENNDITNFQDNKDGTVTLTLEPEARDQKIFITLSTKNYFPVEISLAVDGLLTVTALTDAEINGALPDVFKGL
ncbi:MAG: outer membrane lipoprotein carrier protein LolA [Elusimicrobium sp.]|jgi:outer membrane lipoprotein-sorting protein|nr:outer membrane lipoprotein carrier protein LolA [Elusimicrobium sp.]